MSNKKAFANILSAVSKMKEGSSYNNDKELLWSCETDKAGNGQATIRFLPSQDGASLPFVRVYSHGFKVGGKWFIDKCRTTIGDDCPVCNANSVLWETGDKENQEIVRQRKRKLSFYSNILVISDPKNPDNEGKVFQFRYGKKIFDKIVDKMQPQFDDEEAINPFDPAEGCDFKLRIRQVEGYANFDKSEFTSTSDREDEINAVISDATDLQSLVDEAQFTPAADQEKRLKSVLGQAVQKPRDEDIEESDLAFMKKASSKPKKESDDSDDDLKSLEKAPAPAKKPKPTEDSDEFDADFFKSLIED